MGIETIERPEILGNDTQTGHWVVIVFDNNYNTWDEVIGILIRATGCDHREAEMETWEIHNLGKSCVHHGSEKICQQAAEVIRTIGIRVEVTEE